MKISRIIVENFKGIERVELSPIRPINVILGRNNSGKSSVLSSLGLLTRFIEGLKGAPPQGTFSSEVSPESFRNTDDTESMMSISVTITQGKDERRAQFGEAIRAWNKLHSGVLRTDAGRIDDQLNRNLFGELSFAFGAEAKQGRFALKAIQTKSPDTNDGEEVCVAHARHPGENLRRVPIYTLFVPGRQREFNSISQLASEGGFAERKNISVLPSGLQCSDPQFVTHLIQPAWEFLRERFASSFLLNAYRHGQDTAPATRTGTLSADARNLVPFVLSLNLNNYETFKEISNLVQRVVPEVGRLHNRFTDNDPNSLELAYDWPDGRTVNLANMGGGVEQLVILGCLLLAQKTKCILWEEPESHLHPGAQDTLLSELERLVGNSLIFLTTHSPVFVRASNIIAVHAITNTDGKSAKGRTLSKEELQEASSILGSRPGHLAQADIVVYVEGKSGAAAFEEWIEKWPDKDAILGHLMLVVQPCNPDEIGTEDFDLGTLKKLTPNMIIFVDKDNDTGSTDPKPTRITLTAKCEELAIPYVVTEKRQIEDYFAEYAVKTGLPSNLVETWKRDPEHKLKKGWKRHNRAIARVMSWDDIKQHPDIKSVFEEIESYAQKLKP